MNQFRNAYPLIKAFFDHAILSACLVFAIALTKSQFGIHAGEALAPVEMTLVLLMNLAWYYSGRAVGLYDEFRSRSRVFEIKMLFKAVFFQVIFAIIFIFLLKLNYLGYFFIVAFGCLLAVVLVSWKLTINLVFQKLRKNGRNLRRFIIVGNGEVSRQFQQLMLDNSHIGYILAGYIDDVDRTAKLGSMYRGTIASLDAIIRDEAIDEVVISLPSSENEKIRRVITLCEQYPVVVRMIPDFMEQLSSRFTISLFRDFPIITVRRNPLDELHWRVAKRAFDIVVSILFIVLVGAWLFPLLAAGVKLTSPGPVFFRQERLGRKNKRIVCFKFRSMAADSTDTDLGGHYRQAKRNDSRVTPLGKFLRKTSLDETPQVFNVLHGEMSLVGPRPHPLALNEKSVNEVDRYLLRHLVKPGITGWAQVHGLRGNTEEVELMRKRIEHDIWYIENWMFSLDLNIMMLTILNMFKGEKNAY